MSSGNALAKDAQLRPVKTSMRASLRSHLTAYGFMTPWLIGMIFLTAGSMLFTFYLGFTKYDLLSSPTWIGTKNFAEIWHDSLFWQAIRATLLYVVLSVPFRLIFALLIATALNTEIRGIGIYRALVYVPSLIGGSVGASIGWKKLFGSNGPINSVLSLFGVHTHYWISYPFTAMVVIVLLTVWQFGSEMVIFLAGLKQIPTYLYESAIVDGASRVQRYFRITLPMLSPIIFFNLLMGTIGSFMVFTQVFVITQGGPMNSTMVYILYLYNEAFQYFHMGYAAALAIVLLFIIAAFSGLLFLTSRYWVHYDG